MPEHEDRIAHVVLMMLENHSFDQMLGCFQSKYGDLDGIPSQGPPRTNADSTGRSYEQRPTRALQITPDPKHDHPSVVTQLANRNAGFVRNYVDAYKDEARASAHEIMGYFERGFLPALHALAEEFTICDRWFSSLPGPTWPNRMFALSGTSNGRVFMPDAADHLHMLWSQTQDTIFDRLDERGRTWSVFYYDFPVSVLLRHQRRIENLARYRRIDHFFRLAAQPDAASSFADFTLIEPRYLGEDQNDDHPPHNIMKGQKLIADVYNAIRSNEALWNSTLLIVVYDEHGGFYDHVPPEPALPPDAHVEEFAFDRYGVRVPALLISPWLDAHVEHTRFDHTSILKYLIDKWGLAPLGARANAANSIAAAFRERTSPRSDTIPFIRVANSDLLAPNPDLERQNLTTHHDGLHLLAETLAAPERAIEEAVRRAAQAAAERARSFPAWRTALGNWMIARGRALVREHEDHQKARIAKTAAAVEERQKR
jgi:phospholipase C